MREDLLQLLKQSASEKRQETSTLKAVDSSLKSVLTNVFSVGILQIERITPSHPRSLFENLKEKEAVHKVGTIEEVIKRCQNGRRIYALFHPHLPLDPLVFINVALVNQLPDTAKVPFEIVLEIQ